MPTTIKRRVPALAFVIALATGVAALAGCQQPVAPTLGCDFTPMLKAMRNPGPALVSPVPGTMSEVPLNAVSMTDMSITNKVLVQSVASRRSPTGTVEISTRLMNCTDFPLQVEGRTQFLDEHQQQVEPTSAWQRVHLPARTTGVYTESSTDAQRVQMYLVELREGR
jgi:hypothetical protein